MEADPNGSSARSWLPSCEQADGQLWPLEASTSASTRLNTVTRPANSDRGPRSRRRLPIILPPTLVDSGGAGSGLAREEEEAPIPRHSVQDNKKHTEPANNKGNNGHWKVFGLNLGASDAGMVVQEPAAEIRSQQRQEGSISISPKSRRKGRDSSWLTIAWLILIGYGLAAWLACSGAPASLLSHIRWGPAYHGSAGASFERLLNWPRLAGAIVLHAQAAEESLHQSAPTATAAPIIKAYQWPIDNTTTSNNNETKTSTTTTTTTHTSTTPTPLNEASTTIAATTTTTTTTTSSTPPYSTTTAGKHELPLANDINKHRQPGRGPTNVLCNSRCRCVLVEPQSLAPPAGRPNHTSPTSKHQLISSNRSSNGGQLPTAFFEDYELEDADDDSASATAASSQDESGAEEEPLPRGLLMGGAELSAGSELSPSSASKKSSNAADMRQMFRLGSSNKQQDKQPHPQAAPGPAGRQQAAAVQLYAQAFYSKAPPPSPSLKLSPYLSAGHQVAGLSPSMGTTMSMLDAVSPAVKRIKTHAPRPPAAAAAAAAPRWPSLPANVRLLDLEVLDASGRFSAYSLELETRSNGTRRPTEALLNSTRHLLWELEAGTQVNQPEGLSLRANNMSFELWCELYALLAPHFRKRIYQLDLSHNALPKLGLTFTGFIEHQLVALNGSWPSNQNQPQSATRTGSGSSSTGTAPSPARPKQLLSSGLLYELVVAGAETNLSSVQYYQFHSASNQQATAAAAETPSHTNNNDKLVVQETARSVKSQVLTQPIQIRALDLSHNKIKWLINDQFRALKHVQAIKLDHNRIRYIHRHAFSGLEWLRYLNLNSNRLQVIYTEQFQTNYKLLAIRLRNNYLAYLRGGSFTSLSKLRRLDVSQNKLTLVSANAFVGLESLVHLNCSSNQFLQVPSTSLHPLISLRQLDFSNNLLGQLMPGAFFHLPIVELLLQNNSQLSDIERGAFWDLPYLRQLRLNGNPSLSSINSQAFVGTPNLCTIEAEQCPLLDSETRQLLDNTTTASVMRLLRLEMLGGTDSAQGMSQHQMPPNQTDTGTTTTTTTNNNNSNKSQSVQQADPTESVQRPAGVQAELTPAHLLSVVAPSASLVSQKYLYLLACVGLLAIVIKLLFKYTASSRYLRSVRQRRRVYEANAELAELSLALPSLDQQQHQHQHPIVGHSSVIPAPAASPSFSEDAQHLDQYQQDEEPFSQGDISVISDSMRCEYLQMHNTCSQCPLPECQNAGSSLVVGGHMLEHEPPTSCMPQPLEEQASEEPQVAPSCATLDLIHSQLVAAGYECGHANCAHFYQSLGPAMQLADLAASSDYC